MLEQHILYVVRSPSSRRAWIEILPTPNPPSAEYVALLAEGVDRNHCAYYYDYNKLVALLAEGVDRNALQCLGRCLLAVALLAEGVDRNIKRLRKAVKEPLSPSSRRAWIEIFQLFAAWYCFAVALLAEGVDRNT